MPEVAHARALNILVQRCGQPSIVQLTNGKTCRVHDVACGYDLGDDVAHVTTNISPGPGQPCDVDFFHANEVARIEDAQDGHLLFDAIDPEA